ncbi:vitamin K epoxide reductase family protein [Chitinophaga varians]|uniref:vitamin K epoxide reductase family protein n=1 Tax=Chitinophaga varians TaxID=2202339 RepID=UPI00165F1181|nr:vitamin K epoxide reductase family protein [Chitinophaga varians]MBC9910523.1 thioredoxin domain-containing protein [Chitinophaga varians]
MLTILENFLEPKSNASEAAKLLTDELKVKITRTTLSKEIEEHPDYPSLLSISDVLNKYAVENLAIQLNPDKLEEAPLPLITLIKGRKTGPDFFTVVKEVKKNTVLFYDPERRRWTTQPKEDFLKKYLGAVLLAEPSEEKPAGEHEYAKKLKEEKRNSFFQQLIVFGIPAIVALAAIFAFLHTGMSALLPFLFTTITLAGAVTSALLVWHELDQSNPVTQQICGYGEKSGCGAVLRSKASKIAGISWSAIGFTYFMGQILLLLFSGIVNPRSLLIVSWLNILTLPFLFFSIYYQWQVIKRWCTLCLFIQGLLILQFATALAGSWHSLILADNINHELILMLLTMFAVPFITLMLLTPALENAKENRNNKRELRRLKHNPEIFNALLTKQKAVTEPTEGLGITLGNPDAKHKLIKVCNPYCGPCAKAHTPMDELLNNNPDVQVQLIFLATNNEADSRSLPVKHLLAITEKNSEQLTRQALDDWYLSGQKNYEIFAGKYPLNGELHRQSAKVEAMADWCRKTGIAFTPTFFINGHQLPTPYNLNDLKFFLTPQD